MELKITGFDVVSNHLMISGILLRLITNRIPTIAKITAKVELDTENTSDGRSSTPLSAAHRHPSSNTIQNQQEIAIQMANKWWLYKS